MLRQDEGRVVSQGWDGRGAAGAGWGVTSWYDEGESNGNGNGNGAGQGGGMVQQDGRWSRDNGGTIPAVGRMDSETLGTEMGRGQQRGGDHNRTMMRTTTPSRWGAREEFRADTPNPDDGRLVRRNEGGVMRMGSGRSTGARKEVRWSKDVDYEGRGG